MRIDFCLPIRNEAEVLESNLLTLLNYFNSANFDFSWKIIGVINGSSDNSLDIFRTIKDKFPNSLDYFILDNPGKGGAIKYCWRKSTADILAFMDADLAIAVDSTLKLVSPVINKEADLVISSRFMPGALTQRSAQRGLISRSYVELSRLILGHKKKDIQCGFKVISKSSFSKIEKFLEDDYWFFDTELVVISELAHLKIVEVAVDWRENRNGIKKSNIRVIQDSFNFIVKLMKFRLRLEKIKRYFYKF
jgi:glycosyltransferase involved in cell wall biosynthesis